MLPVLWLFTFQTPFAHLVLYALAGALVIYGAYAGWRGAEAKDQAPIRAVVFGAISAAVAYYGVKYALVNGAPLHTYGLMIATGFIVAITVAAREAERCYAGVKVLDDGTMMPMGSFMREIVMDLSFYLLISGMVGARILFIIVNWDDIYSKNPSDIFSLSGGLVFYGGFIGAALVVVWYAKRHKLDFLKVGDVIIPSVSIGHALGRLGCLSAGCCWGGFAKPGTSWALKFPGAGGAPFGQSSLAFQSQMTDHRLLSASTHQLLTQYVPNLDAAGQFVGTWTDRITGAAIHAIPAGAIDVAMQAAKLGHTLPIYPTQLMESMGELCIFTILVLARRTKRFNGQIVAMYLMMYSILRTFIETFRGDEERGRIFGAITSIPRTAWYNLSTSEFVSVCIFATGVVLWLKYGRRKPELDGSTPAASAAA